MFNSKLVVRFNNWVFKRAYVEAWTGQLWCNWSKLTKKLTVSIGDTSWSINFDTILVVSHVLEDKFCFVPLLGNLSSPCWFWIITHDPGFNGGRSWVPEDHLSEDLITRFLEASSLISQLFTQTFEGVNWPGWMGKKSRMGLPKTNWLGDKLYSATGVFLYCISAFITLSQSGDPSDLVLSISNRLPDLTAVSARRLLCGWYAELTLWFFTPQLWRNCFNWVDLNCGPSSLDILQEFQICKKSSSTFQSSVNW